jgi:hypothetical protein
VRCPACNERVIDFLAWGQGINAFKKVDCPSCGAPLRTSRRTFVMVAVLATLLVPLIVGVAETTKTLGVPEATGRVIFGCLMIPLVLAVSYWEWRTGRYELRQRDGLTPKK